MRELPACLLAVLLGAAPAAAQDLTPVAPQPGESVTLLRPAIVFAIPPLPAAAGLDRSQVRLLLDGEDLTEFLSWGREQLRVRPPLPVAAGPHAVEVRRRRADGGEDVIGKVEFQAVPPRRRVLATGHLADAPMSEKPDAKPVSLTVAPHADGALAGAAGEVRYDLTWPHVFAAGAPAGPPPAALLHYEQGPFLTTAGATQGTAFEGAKLLGIASGRQILEGRWDGLTLGRLTLLTSLPDAPQGTGGERSFEQALRGASWQAASTGRLAFRLFGQQVREQGNGDATAASSLSRAEDADLLGMLLGYRLGAGWEGEVEAAWSHRETRELGAAPPHGAADTAYRMDLHGTLAGTLVQARFSRIGPRYGDPANPGIVRDREEAGLDLSRTLPRWSYRIYGASSRDGLAAGLPGSRELLGGLALGATLPWEIRAALAWEQQRVTGGPAPNDNRTATLDLSWTRNRLTLDLQGKDTASDGAISRTLVHGWQATTLFSGGGAWSLAGGAGIETRSENGRPTRVSTFSLQPSWAPLAGRLALALDFQGNTTRTAGQPAVDSLSGRGSVTWKLPDGWQGASLGVELGWQRINRLVDHRGALRLSFSPAREWRR
ncbi:MAG TPA: hypothetical protein VFC23_08780 [Thermoanaerobaculia bacterium]|nr:hypothetical protein [Thermoanaerobaculia bacterium]